MKLFALVLITFLTHNSYAQIYFGTSHQYEKTKILKKINDNYHNNILSRAPEIGYAQCQKDHALILDIIKGKHKKKIVRILEEAYQLHRFNEYEGLRKTYLENKILKNLVSFIIISEMKKELMSKNLKEIVYEKYNKKIKDKRKVFEMKYQNINIESYFTEALKSMKDIKYEKTVPGWLINEIKSSIISEIVSQFAKNSFKIIVNGVALELSKKVIAGTVSKQMVKAGLKKVAISFSGNVLASVGKGLVIELLTMPLKGNRLPPETLWLEVLNEYPGSILNPELMIQAGINDAEWPTHCNTINRRAFSVERVLEKLIKDIEKTK